MILKYVVKFNILNELSFPVIRKNIRLLGLSFQAGFRNQKYTGWLVTGGTSGKGVMLREKRSRKYRIKIFRLRLCFRENRLWIFARYACTLSRLGITDLTVDRCLDGYYRSLSLFVCRNGKLRIHNEIIWSNHKVYYYKNCWKCCPFCRTHTSAFLIKFLWTLSNVFDCFKIWKATIIFYFNSIQFRFSREQSLKRKTFILYFRLLFSRRITPFPIVPPVTNPPVYCIQFSIYKLLDYISSPNELIRWVP